MAAATETCLSYRGKVRAVLGRDDAVLLVTAHPERQSTALVRLGADGAERSSTPLPAGAPARPVAAPPGDTALVASCAPSSIGSRSS